MNNENPKQQLIDEYIKKVNNTPDIELNQDQKELIKEILTKIDPKYIQNAYQMLNQRVKIGFTFDEAPSTSKTNIALLVKDEKRSFINNVMNASDWWKLWCIKKFTSNWKNKSNDWGGGA